MHLTLFVPDLLWPDIDDAAAFDFPGAADFARFLALSAPTRSALNATDSWESRLATLFDFPEQHAPLAALRSLGESLPASGLQLCTDPVNLDFMQQALVLSPIAATSLSDSDITALLQTLNDEFAEEGHFVAHRQGNDCHWTFVPEPNHGALPDLAACSRLAGRRVDADETRALLGREGLRWINRIQMCLNQHPVNAAREASGLPPINSLWPWGLGRLGVIPPTRFASAQGQNALLFGLCKTTQTPCTADTTFPHGTGQHLVAETQLTTALSHNDLDAWQSTLGNLVSTWISPALAALANGQGQLQSLTLISPNAHHEHRWVLKRSSKGLRGTFLQRWLGRTRKTPNLHALVCSWSS